MTDNTQEIDEILALLDARMPRPKTMNESTARVAMLRGAKQAILDWHNKQVEGVLDRLEQSAVKYGGNNVMNVGVPNIAVPLSIIEAERNKLKEAEL